MRAYDRALCIRAIGQEELRLELRIEEGMCSRRNSMCRGPVATKCSECSRNAEKDSVIGV